MGFLLGSHIAQISDEQLQSGLKFVPKLTSDHINLTPYSVMRVNLAAQVLSDTVGNVLTHFGPPEAAGTAKFCFMMDKCLDCLNVRNTNEHELKRKPFLKPYKSVNDERFAWLDNFLEYFHLWKDSIDERPDNFKQNARSRMFISWQTYEGIQVTVHSFKEVVKYLLENGVKYGLSERFCQDDLENYFGRQRAIGRDAKIIHQSEMLVIMITRSNHNFQYDLLLVMFKVQLENLTKLITPHHQREENDYLKMIIISMWAYFHRREVCGLMLPSAQKNGYQNGYCYNHKSYKTFSWHMLNKASSPPHLPSNNKMNTYLTEKNKRVM